MNGRDIVKYLVKLDTCFKNLYSFSNPKEAENAICVMSNLFSVVVGEMHDTANDYGINDVFHTEMEKLRDFFSDYGY